jgi:hypothetical protein
MSFPYRKRGDQEIPSCPIQGKQRAAKSHECHAKPSEHRGATLLGTIMRKRLVPTGGTRIEDFEAVRGVLLAPSLDTEAGLSC